MEMVVVASSFAALLPEFVVKKFKSQCSRALGRRFLMFLKDTSSELFYP